MHHNNNTTQFVITVTGKVQGVFYRASTLETAEQLGIEGWVKNQPDGSVQITAVGTTEQLESLITWCWQGPAKAEVSHVSWEKSTPESFEGFTVRR